MKTIQIIAVIVFSLVSTNVAFAQDEFYNEDPKNQSSELVNEKEMVNEENYSTYKTENDFNENENEVIKNENYIKEDNNEGEERKRRRRQANTEFVAEIMVDVFINTVFIIAAFWQ
ncbi:MAG: hypothetical protein KDD29_00580 [Flavobacteriales bacterium]|nr:hypothetical protein [Flavobacteriales bacterium]MCB9335962.1 hypothetical protein [Flavobacteriales bacterium]